MPLARCITSVKSDEVVDEEEEGCSDEEVPQVADFPFELFSAS